MKSDLWMLCCWCHWVCIIRSYLSERGDLIKTNRSVKLQIQWAVLSSFRQLLSSCTPLSICSANLIVVFQQYRPDSACNRAFLSEAATNSLLNQQKHPGGEMNALSVCLYICSYEAGSVLSCRCSETESLWSKNPWRFRSLQRARETHVLWIQIRSTHNA